jgi:hypothetical protein
MPDPEQLLADLPQESPPPEIVLAAVRGARYRAIAFVVTVVTIVLVAGFLVDRHLAEPPDPAVAAKQAARDGETVFPAVRVPVRGGEAMLWEVVRDGDRGWARSCCGPPR